MKVSETWVRNGFIPPNLNFVVLDGSLDVSHFNKYLRLAWPGWNLRIPAGHYACLKLYISYTVPLYLFQNAPVHQFQYGEAVTCPFVHASIVGIGKWLILTQHNDGNKTLYKAKMYPQSQYWYDTIHDQGQDHFLQLRNSIDNLTELDLSGCNLDFTQVIVACPQLRRLNLQGNTTLRVEDLQVIATCYCNLQGLNLKEIPITNGKLCMSVWETLSSIRLTHLRSIDYLSPSRMDDVQEKRLVALFKQCRTLQALELANPPTISNYKLLSYLPSLEYLRLCANYNDDQECACVQELLTACDKLRYFYCDSSVLLSSLPVHNNLQELCILSLSTNLDDNFMYTVSAHGGLVHVAFFVRSVTTNGITTLIRNSPNLLTSLFGLFEPIQEDTI